MGKIWLDKFLEYYYLQPNLHKEKLKLHFNLTQTITARGVRKSVFYSIIKVNILMMLIMDIVRL